MRKRCHDKCDNGDNKKTNMSTIDEVFKKIKEDKDNLEFLPTGFHGLDSFLDGGFMRKELVVLGGGTGIGKSYFASQMFWNVVQKGFRSVYYSMEISNEMVASRIVGSICNIKPTRLIAGQLKPEEQRARLEAEAEVLSCREYMEFHDDLYVLDAIAEDVRKKKYDFVVIDFIQNIMSRGDEEYSRLSYATLELQKLEKETNSCILVLSQLSNMAIREGSKTDVVEYKGSGSIATACDLGFFVKRDLTGTTADENGNLVRMMLKKNRRGISGVEFILRFKQPGGAISEN